MGLCKRFDRRARQQSAEKKNQTCNKKDHIGQQLDAFRRKLYWTGNKTLVFMN